MQTNSIAENIAEIRKQIAQICAKNNRPVEEVELLAVTKTVDSEIIKSAIAAGCTLIGENRVQEAKAKAPDLADIPHELHLIGHLQSNKLKTALDLISCLQSLDSLELAHKLQAELERRGRKLAVLIELNTSLESQKHGINPADAHDFIRAVRELPNLELQGLMTVAKDSQDEREIRACFRLLHDIRAQDWQQYPEHAQIFRHLSMGMSSDWQIALEEGASILRLGSAIFGART